MSTMIKLGLVSLLSAAVVAVPTPSGYIPSASAYPYALGTGPHHHYHAGNASDVYSPTGTRGHRHRKHKLTTTWTRTSTEVVTEYVTVSPSLAAAPAAETAPSSGAASSQCSTPTVYETAIHRVTVTVQENAEPTPYAAAPTSTSSSAVPVVSVAPVAVSVAPVAVSSAPVAAPAPYDSGSKSVSSVLYPEPYSLTYTPKAKQLAAPTAADIVAAAAAAPTQAAAAVGNVVASAVGSGKRGVAYNDVAYTGCFAGKSKMSWGYNWGQVSGGLGSGFEYVPMLWGSRSDFTSTWVGNAKSAIAAGSSHILAFNEPDLAAQSNMDPGTAATAYMQYIHSNFAGTGVRLGSPAVTNGGGAMGLTWLTTFLAACSTCQVDFVAIHWYDMATNPQYFMDHVTQAHTLTGKPVWVTEFGATGSNDQISAFLEQVLPWLDSQDFVERYSYFMAADGLLNTGTELSSYGTTFATY